jgi:hypothetical protein
MLVDANDEIAAGGFVELDGRTKIDVAVRHAGGAPSGTVGIGDILPISGTPVRSEPPKREVEAASTPDCGAVEAAR